MKPQLLKISTPSDYSFNLFDQEADYFPTPWHYHPEVEIVFMQKSVGEKYIGSSITDFEPGDLAMIGSYLPHYYKNSSEYYEKDSGLRAKSLVIHFNEDFLGASFLDAPENHLLKQLLDNCKRGLQFGKRFVEELEDDLTTLSEKEGMPRLLSLLAILNKMSKTKDFKFLTSDPIYLNNHVDSDRIKKVFEYVMQNFQQDIKLNDIAGLASMSESAFSRYFKKRTRKTFSTFLTEIRIEHACKLLQKDKHSVSEVSYESGFNNLSNFNRQFKSVKSTTPLSYRSRFLS
ncbi:AraC family transcriptional regulator [Arcticibacterium luteifluviistationis]|uniref:AraC family transcriptional regulator n=1 Tax=Arcticibacterium luteifluviistationis TaxID=1784714 RepID=A0A2Z4GEB8_9BACT|nr:AraC family transcriptional regulator [Arcticibacterium luteifluviistationis]AWV99659.1 AraC family transcriptional regulator [Arcticibacterium luteifluviistationis]